jgi:hypothetical protein
MRQIGLTLNLDNPAGSAKLYLSQCPVAAEVPAGRDALNSVCVITIYRLNRNSRSRGKNT